MSVNYREPEDLLSDESFLAWYFQRGEGQGIAWEQWMADNPGSHALVQQAIDILNSVRIPEKELPAGQVRRAEAALMEGIKSGMPTPIRGETAASGPQTRETAVPTPMREETGTPASPIPLYKDRRWIAAASVLVLFTTGLLVTRAIRHRQPEVKTAYGQISRQQLPDGTEVTINANSKLRYSPDWKDGDDREVWVNGEAFFHVQKTPQKSRFIVHTDHFDIIVTGTQFNVVNRRGKDNVLLQEGSIILHTSDGRELHLTPGDFVEFNRDQLAKRPAKNDSVLAWKEQKLVFDKTPLRELVSIINDQYGVDVKLSSDSIGDKKISAILPNNNLDVLLQALVATSEFDVVRQDGVIIIRAHAE
ncbi:MAG TPA: FecR domain-containing protein [Puia sp.]|nr:FecR domain-containing protein [Puia sp.]